METSEVGIHRLNNQHVGDNRFTSVKELVGWMGAMQAQDLNSAKWGIGVRLPGLKELMIDEAINKGEIIRTHVMRPTWHLVAAEDYHDIMKLTAPSILQSLKSRHKQLELDEPFIKKSNPEIERILGNGNHLTREELTRELAKSISNIDSSRMNHILLRAELEGLIGSGSIKKKQHSYALVQERVKIHNDKFDKDRALALLAGKYFGSHGPATLQDFNWWSGLSVLDCRKAIEMIKHKLHSMEIGSRTYWFEELHQQAGAKATKGMTGNGKSQRLFLLPAYDEFLISYKDRSAVLALADQQRTVSSNGIFRPVIVLDGQVVGLWNKKLRKGVIEVLPDLSIKEDESIKDMVNKASDDYMKFIS